MNGERQGPMIETVNLSRRFGSVLAVDDVSIGVMGGEVFGLLGSNGAGKTTTMKILACLLRPSGGRALVSGLDVVKQPLDVKRRIGYLPEMPALFDRLTGMEFMEMMGILRGMNPKTLASRVEQYTRVLEMDDFLDLEIGTYSKGMRQRLAFAASVLHQPPVLLLDEPTSGLDPRYAKKVKAWIREYAGPGRAVLMSTHVTEIADSLCDRLAIIHNGRVVGMGTPRELKSMHSVDTLEDVFVRLVEG